MFSASLSITHCSSIDGVHLKARWLVLTSCFGLLPVAWLVWAWNTPPPPAPILVADAIAMVGLMVGPWLVLVGRRLIHQMNPPAQPAAENASRHADETAGLRGGEAASRLEPEAGRVFSRLIIATGLIAIGGPIAALTIGTFVIETPGMNAGLAVVSILTAAIVALVGGVVLPWRYLTRERAARVRAGQRAEMAAHLHDTVLQALTLIQKRSGEPGVLRLARRTERELRAWLYGAPKGDDLATAVRALAEEIEDRFAVAIELGVVGTCGLDDASRAVLGALREALTNAAKHSQVRKVTAYVEAGEGEVLALVRDRGRGFDLGIQSGQRQGIKGSIEGRMRSHGGVAEIRSTVGGGTEVELRMPMGAT